MGDSDSDRAVEAEDEAKPAVVAKAVPVPAPREETALERGDALSRYMAELRHHAPITREEEHALAVRWKEEGDAEAGRELVLANLRLVVKIAMEYRRSWTQVLDLIQEGNVGLVQAVERFDPTRGNKLSTYAAYWIRAYILKFLIDNIRLVRMGSSRAERKLFFRLNKEKRALEAQGFAVEPKLIAERLDVSEQDVVQMEQRLAEGELSFDAPVQGDEGSRATFGDFVAAGGDSPETQLGESELRRTFLEQVDAFGEGLDERESRILRDRVLAEDALTLQELGEEFGVSRERVRQLEARLVDRLREHLRENVVDFEYYAPED